MNIVALDLLLQVVVPFTLPTLLVRLVLGRTGRVLDLALDAHKLVLHALLALGRSFGPEVRTAWFGPRRDLGRLLERAGFELGRVHR